MIQQDFFTKWARVCCEFLMSNVVSVGREAGVRGGGGFLLGEDRVWEKNTDFGAQIPFSLENTICYCHAHVWKPVGWSLLPSGHFGCCDYTEIDLYVLCLLLSPLVFVFFFLFLFFQIVPLSPHLWRFSLSQSRSLSHPFFSFTLYCSTSDMYVTGVTITINIYTYIQTCIYISRKQMLRHNQLMLF